MTAAKSWKRVGIGIFAVGAAIVAALALVPHFIPAEHIRETVKSEIRAVTGFDPLLRGQATLSFFPSTTVTFRDVVLGGDAQADPALSAESLTAQLRLLPLLIGRVEVDDVLLVRPRINVGVAPDGRSNWSRLVNSLSRSLKPEVAVGDKTVSFSQIRITDGSIFVRDSGRGIDEVFNEVALSLAWPSMTRGLGATGRVVWRGQPVDVSLNLADLFAALSGERSGVKLRLTAAPLKFAFDGHLSYRSSIRIQGALAADSPSLREALRWTGQRPLPGGGFGPFALKAQVNVNGNSVSLPSVNIELDGNAAEGVLSFAMNGRPLLQGTLAAEALDLSHYVSAARLLRQNERDWSRVPVRLDGLKGFDLDLRLSAARIAVMGAKLGRTAIAANLSDGRLAVTVGESQAFGGILKGTIGVGTGPSGADLKAQLAFVDVDLETCLGEFFAVRRLEGKGNLAINVEGSGANVLDITKTLSGQATITARQGAISGFNVEQALRRLERQPLSLGGEFRSGRTPFDTFSLVLKLANGIATVDEVKFEGSAIKLAVSGSASIPARDLDLRGTASLLGAATGDRAGAFELPFVVQGRWDDPIMLPDAESLIRRSRATAPLLDAIKGRTAREAVRSAIEQLTRGGASASAPPPPAAAAPVANQIPASR